MCTLNLTGCPAAAATAATATPMPTATATGVDPAAAAAAAGGAGGAPASPAPTPAPTTAPPTLVTPGAADSAPSLLASDLLSVLELLLPLVKLLPLTGMYGGEVPEGCGSVGVAVWVWVAWG